MRTNIRRAAAVISVLVTTAAATSVPASASASYTCGMVSHASFHGDGGFKTNDVRNQMYNGPDAGRCVSNGRGYFGDSVTYWCALPGAGGYGYTFLTDWTRNTRGYVPNYLLLDNGADWRCE